MNKLKTVDEKIYLLGTELCCSTNEYFDWGAWWDILLRQSWENEPSCFLYLCDCIRKGPTLSVWVEIWSQNYIENSVSNERKKFYLKK